LTYELNLSMQIAGIASKTDRFIDFVENMKWKIKLYKLNYLWNISNKEYLLILVFEVETWECHFYI